MLGARPWGSRSSVLRAVAGLLVDAVDRHGLDEGVLHHYQRGRKALTIEDAPSAHLRHFRFGFQMEAVLDLHARGKALGQ